jgi:hypothetical protein
MEFIPGISGNPPGRELLQVLVKKLWEIELK